MAKFFIPLGFRYGEGSPDTYSHVNCIYGPYADDESVDEALSRLWPNDKDVRVLVLDGNIRSVVPSPLELPEAIKREPGNMNNYERRGEDLVCRSCDAHIRGATVYHPVHLRDMPGVGFGECRQEVVPYCPNCDRRPDPQGCPVYDE